MERHYLMTDVFSSEGELRIVETPDLLSDWPRLEAWKNPQNFGASIVVARYNGFQQARAQAQHYGLNNLTPVLGYNMEGTDPRYMEQIERTPVPSV